MELLLGSLPRSTAKDKRRSRWVRDQSLLADLKGAKATGVAWQTGLIINALLEKAKEEQPDNIVLAVIEPLEPGFGARYVSTMNYDDVRAILGQMVAATEPAPFVAAG